MVAGCWEVRRDDNYMYKSGPADEKWTKPDLSSHCYIRRPASQVGWLENTGLRQGRLCTRPACNNIQVGLSMRSAVLTDGMRHIVTWHNRHQSDTRQDWCPVTAWMMTSPQRLSLCHQGPHNAIPSQHESGRGQDQIITINWLIAPR